MQKIVYLILSCLLITHVYAATSTFTLGSESFLNQETLKSLYTCDGKDISPELHWENSPSQTQSFALILADPDAPGETFYHWVVYNIPKHISYLPEGMIHYPLGMKLANNNWHQPVYKGPCPPKGQTHRYVFTLYALNTMLNLSSDADAATLLSAIKNHVVGTAELTAIYHH